MPQFGKQDVTLFNLNVTLIILITWDHSRIPTYGRLTPRNIPRVSPSCSRALYWTLS